MSESEKLLADEQKIDEGYRPYEKGYNPTQGKLDPNNPPKGGSGVNHNNIDSHDKEDKK